MTGASTLKMRNKRANETQSKEKKGNKKDQSGEETFKNGKTISKSIPFL
jgi:hypothetical protein